MYASLCYSISEHNATWPFIKTVAYTTPEGANKFFWLQDLEADEEFVGPYVGKRGGGRDHRQLRSTAGTDRQRHH